MSILSWSDKEVEKEQHNFWHIQNDTILDDFLHNYQTRKNIIETVERVLRLYGYTIIRTQSKLDVIQIQPMSKNRGLYLEKNYKHITRMLLFLNRIKMRVVSSLVLLAICNAMRVDPELKDKFIQNGLLNKWLATQDYIAEGFSEQIKDQEKISQTTLPRGLQYIDNSCYQDSTLLALFGQPNKFITENILKKDVSTIGLNKKREIACSDNIQKDYEYRHAIQNELNILTELMRNSNKNTTSDLTCTNLRKLFRHCRTGQSFHRTNTQDAGEFVQYIFGLFQVGGLTKVRKTIVTNDLSVDPVDILLVTQIEEIVSPVVLIPAYDLESEVKLTKFLVHVDDSGMLDQNNLYKHNKQYYQRRIEMNIVVKADYLVFYVQRTYVNKRGHVDRNYSSIIPEETIRLNQRLTLFAIIVHRNNHYTAYIKVGNIFYYYDDLKSSLKRIGNYTDLLMSENNRVQKEGVLYFYT